MRVGRFGMLAAALTLAAGSATTALPAGIAAQGANQGGSPRLATLAPGACSDLAAAINATRGADDAATTDAAQPADQGQGQGQEVGVADVGETTAPTTGQGPTAPQRPFVDPASLLPLATIPAPTVSADATVAVADPVTGEGVAAVAFETLLGAESWMLLVHQSDDPTSDPAACADVRGDATTGQLTLGLRPLGRAEVGGVAFLAPATEPASTYGVVILVPDIDAWSANRNNRDGAADAQAGGNRADRAARANRGNRGGAGGGGSAATAGGQPGGVTGGVSDGGAVPPTSDSGAAPDADAGEDDRTPRPRRTRTPRDPGTPIATVAPDQTVTPAADATATAPAETPIATVEATATIDPAATLPPAPTPDPAAPTAPAPTPDPAAPTAPAPTAIPPAAPDPAVPTVDPAAGQQTAPTDEGTDATSQQVIDGDAGAPDPAATGGDPAAEPTAEGG